MFVAQGDKGIIGYKWNSLFLFAIIQASVSALALILCFIPYMWMLGVPVLIGVAVWGIVEGILILTGNSGMDAQGNPLRE